MILTLFSIFMSCQILYYGAKVSQKSRCQFLSFVLGLCQKAYLQLLLHFLKITGFSLIALYKLFASNNELVTTNIFPSVFFHLLITQKTLNSVVKPDIDLPDS